MDKLNEYKKVIWARLKNKEWTKEYLLAEKTHTADHDWNLALQAAQQWARQEITNKAYDSQCSSVKNKLTRKIRKDVDTEFLMALASTHNRNKTLKKSKKQVNIKPREKDRSVIQDSEKRYIDEGIGGSRSDNLKMRARQSLRNKNIQ